MTPDVQAAADAVRIAIANAEAQKTAMGSDFDCAALVHPNHLRTLLAALDDTASRAEAYARGMHQLIDALCSVRDAADVSLHRNTPMNAQRIRDLVAGRIQRVPEPAAAADRHQPLTDQPCGHVPTDRGRQAVLDYHAIRRQQNPRGANQ